MPLARDLSPLAASGRRKAPDTPEKDVQGLICAYLDARQIPYAVTNVAPKGWKRRGRKKDAGWPDVTACYKGRFIGIEVKRERGGVVRDSQTDKHEQLRRHDAVIIVARTLDEVIAILARI